MLNNLQTSYVSYSWGFVTAIAEQNKIRHSFSSFVAPSLKRVKSRLVRLLVCFLQILSDTKEIRFKEISIVTGKESSEDSKMLTETGITLLKTMLKGFSQGFCKRIPKIRMVLVQFWNFFKVFFFKAPNFFGSTSKIFRIQTSHKKQIQNDIKFLNFGSIFSENKI